MGKPCYFKRDRLAPVLQLDLFSMLLNLFTLLTLSTRLEYLFQISIAEMVFVVLLHVEHLVQLRSYLILDGFLELRNSICVGKAHSTKRQALESSANA